MNVRRAFSVSILSLALAISSANAALADPLPPDRAAAAADSAVAAEGAAPSGVPQGLQVQLPTMTDSAAAAISSDGSTITLRSLSPSAEITQLGGKSIATLAVPSSSVVTEPVADGVRSLVVINAPDAPTRFDYELGLPSGISAKPLPDGSFALEQAGEEGLSTTVRFSQ